MFRLAYFVTHPIQYQVPLLRFLAASEELELRVFFYSDYSLHAHRDPGYGVNFKWDVPLLGGYAHEFLTRAGGGKSRQKQALLPARNLAGLLRGFDAVWIHGWSHVCSLQAILAARRLGIPSLIRGDSFPDSLKNLGWRRTPKRWLLPRLFQRISGFLCAGSMNRQFYREYGVPAERLFVMPYAVDNQYFQEQATRASLQRESFRRSLKLEPGRPVILFAGMFQPVKSLPTLIDATARLAARLQPAPYLLLIGDGPLRSVLEEQARALPEGLVRFMGFRNQTELPAFYDLCDVFVLPSISDAWGLVVNEVMNASRPVVVSDRVGAGPDLVKPGENGFIFRVGDTEDLADKLCQVLSPPERGATMGRRSLDIINQWDFASNRTALLHALAATCARKSAT